MRVVTVVIALCLLVGASSAATIQLRGLYGVSVLGHDCIQAGGTTTSGVGSGGYGCKTETGDVECTARGQCVATCDKCGTLHHRTGIYGILHAGAKQ
jgi:hypothetical protein